MPHICPQLADVGVLVDECYSLSMPYGLRRNPVKRGLVEKLEDWKWSSFRHYATAEIGAVEIESQWTADRGADELRSRYRFTLGESKEPTSAKIGQMWGTVERRTQMWATSHD